MKYKVLTIAGSDSGCGAGIQGDLKTFSSFGVYGLTAITSITAQNTKGVQHISHLSEEIVGNQIESVLEDIGTDTAKTGMLGNSSIIEIVAEKIKKYSISHLVIDPVMVSTGGKELLSKDAIKVLQKKLFPLATLICPNIPEAQILSGRSINSIEEMKSAAKILSSKKRGVLIKGGHLKSERKMAPDLLYYHGKYHLFTSERIQQKNTHGTGCVLSAAIAASLSKGMPMVESVKTGKEFITETIKNGIQLGSGIGPVNPLGRMWRDAEKYQLLIETEEAFFRLKESKIGSLIPEIQSNLVAALKDASGFEDVIGFPTRIIKDGNSIATLRRPQFGGSRHVANIVLTAMKFDSSMRSAMNLKYTPELVNLCKQIGLCVTSFDRKKEPKNIKELEGSTLEWGIATAIEIHGGVPDIIFDKGDDGKEPVIRVMGESPQIVASKVILIRKKMAA